MEGGQWTKEGWIQTDYNCKHRAGDDADPAADDSNASSGGGGGRYDMPRQDHEKIYSNTLMQQGDTSKGKGRPASVKIPAQNMVKAGEEKGFVRGDSDANDNFAGISEGIADGGTLVDIESDSNDSDEDEFKEPCYPCSQSPEKAPIAGGEGERERYWESPGAIAPGAFAQATPPMVKESGASGALTTAFSSGFLRSPSLPRGGSDKPDSERPTALLQIKRLISEDLSERLEPQNLDNLRHAVVEENDVTEEMARAFGDLDKCVQRRRKYQPPPPVSDALTRVKPSPTPPFLPFTPSRVVETGDHCFVEPSDSFPRALGTGGDGGYEINLDPVNGVFSVNSPIMGTHKADVTICEFYTDLRRTMKVIGTASVNSTATKRLMLLEAKFKMYLLLNEEKEFLAIKINPHRDFYNVRKVDTHIHHSAAMHQKHLLRFIKKKLKVDADRIVIFRDGKELTLAEVFESLKMTAYDLSLDMMDVHADNSTLHRFDRFNLKYNPCGSSRLREIFLKTDNKIEGDYLAGITHELFRDYQEAKYQMSELRLSIYGRSEQEWTKLAKWIINNKLYCENVRWIIQVPRLYHVHRKTVPGMDKFSDMTRNIFGPLFEATRDPGSHPELHLFLQQIVGFDSVDDESLGEKKIWRSPPSPDTWTSEDNPPYSYYCYQMWSNISVLNKFRRERGFGTFEFRPHCGEAGDIDHMVAAFLCAHAVNHGITMRHSPSLQYLFFLEQIGLAMSPMSNNALFLSYNSNPFDLYFKRGLNVSLSTDDPLQFHLTKDPLIEEYGMAKQMWKYSTVDLCEIARNSVLQSGFEDCVKAYFLGDNFKLPGNYGNSIARTNVPGIRIEFRHDTLTWERSYLAHAASLHYAGHLAPIRSPSGPDKGRPTIATVEPEKVPLKLPVIVAAEAAAGHKTNGNGRHNGSSGTSEMARGHPGDRRPKTGGQARSWRSAYGTFSSKGGGVSDGGERLKRAFRLTALGVVILLLLHWMSATAAGGEAADAVLSATRPFFGCSQLLEKSKNAKAAELSGAMCRTLGDRNSFLDSLFVPVLVWLAFSIGSGL